MQKLKVRTKEVKKIEGYTPNKDIILITGKVEVLGVELFCGSVVYDNEDGLEIRSCNVLNPDMSLYQSLEKADVQVGSIIEIKRTRNKGSRQIKNQFTITQVDVEDIEVLAQIKSSLEEFDSSWYDVDNVEF
jgi:hypothetical protein